MLKSLESISVYIIIYFVKKLILTFIFINLYKMPKNVKINKKENQIATTCVMIGGKKVSCGQENKDYEESLFKARVFLNKKDYDNTIKILNKWIKSCSNMLPLCLELSYVYQEMGDIDLFFKSMEKVVEIIYEDYRWFLGFFKSSDKGRLVDILEDIIVIYPTNFLFRKCHIQIRASYDLREESMKTFLIMLDDLMKLNPNDIDLWELKLDICAELWSSINEKLTCYNNILRIDDANVKAYLKRWRINHHLKNDKEAEEDLDKLTKLLKNKYELWFIYFYKAMVRKSIQDFKGSLKNIEKALSISSKIKDNDEQNYEFTKLKDSLLEKMNI